MAWPDLHIAMYRSKNLRWPPIFELIYSEEKLSKLRMLPRRMREIIAFIDQTSAPMSEDSPGEITDISQMLEPHQPRDWEDSVCNASGGVVESRAVPHVGGLREVSVASVAAHDQSPAFGFVLGGDVRPCRERLQWGECRSVLASVVDDIYMARSGLGGVASRSELAHLLHGASAQDRMSCVGSVSLQAKITI